MKYKIDYSQKVGWTILCCDIEFGYWSTYVVVGQNNSGTVEVSDHLGELVCHVRRSRAGPPPNVSLYLSPHHSQIIGVFAPGDTMLIDIVKTGCAEIVKAKQEAVAKLKLKIALVNPDFEI